MPIPRPPLRLAAFGAALLALLVTGSGHAGGRVVVVEQKPSEMVVVPGGPFLMGFGAEILTLKSDEERIEQFQTVQARVLSQCLRDYGRELAGLACTGRYLWEASLPFRTVHVDSFAIDRHEVTTAEYRECVAAGACSVTPLVTGDTRYLRSSWPIVNVTWFDASAYCRFRGKRLPTEAEWEKAARGTDGRMWPWGSYYRPDGGNVGKLDSEAVRTMGRSSSGFNYPLDTVTGDPADGYPYLAPPGAMVWGVSPYGVHDMVGNVAEWTADYFAESGYAGLPRINPVRSIPANGAELWRTIRGGSWLRVPVVARPDARAGLFPNQRRIDVGMRCARSVR